jgi:hypothetical protein
MRRGTRGGRQQPSHVKTAYLREPTIILTGRRNPKRDRNAIKMPACDHASSKPLAVCVTYWKLYVETPKRKKHARGRRGCIRGRAAELRRARCALEPAGASPARARGRARGGGGACIERSLAMLVGLLGILKAGGAAAAANQDHRHSKLPAGETVRPQSCSSGLAPVSTGHSA